MLNSGNQYVSEEGLKNLKHYKYSAVDKSPISQYILKHYWNWCVTLFPRWMAPNLITLIGFGFVVFNLVTMIIFVPDLKGPGPSWIYYSFAAGIWLYSTFDNVDGKQARRTGTSSPLGELFDHGCDALNCAVGALVQAASLGLGFTWYSCVVTFLTSVAFYFSTWEEYHTGTLYLGYINGPTEGLIIACIMSIMSGVYGPELWQSKVHDVAPPTFPGLSHIPTHYKLIDLAVVSMVGLLFTAHIPFSVVAVYKACHRKGTSFGRALTQLSPLVVMLGFGGFWLSSPYSVALERHFVLFVMANGIVFGRMATKIILAHVTKMPFPMFSTGMLIPLIAGSIVVNLPRFNFDVILTPEREAIYLWVFFVLAAINYLHWALLVIDKFCTFLGIKCLSIPYGDKRE
ncbi:CDP-alcohol phosphatidyltransferase-domain-containing protein [Paraphysoderma sedebokerense]|nr:CDP-alcohol phosphatidyltransferase-domain-containing protein [Paraphysoderma sedebokerense]